MNVTKQLSFRKDGKTVLGSGDWFVDNDGVGSFCYSGIWRDGKVIALVFDETSDSDVVAARGDLFVKAVNAHDGLVAALKDCLHLIQREVADGGYTVQAIKAAKALAAAGEPV